LVAISGEGDGLPRVFYAHGVAAGYQIFDALQELLLIFEHL
jgi:hypothetical protein